MLLSGEAMSESVVLAEDPTLGLRVEVSRLPSGYVSIRYIRDSERPGDHYGHTFTAEEARALGTWLRAEGFLNVPCIGHERCGNTVAPALIPGFCADCGKLICPADCECGEEELS
jgi:hypothetical protein